MRPTSPLLPPLQLTLIQTHLNLQLEAPFPHLPMDGIVEEFLDDSQAIFDREMDVHGMLQAMLRPEAMGRPEKHEPEAQGLVHHLGGQEIPVDVACHFPAEATFDA